MNQLNAMRVFRRVVELNGFSAAARELGISNAAISKNVSDLEAHLGAQLLVRTTRRLSVTEVGDAYYRRCVAILQDLEEADLTAASNSCEPRGRLRVNAPMSFGLLHVAPLVSEFLFQYQDIEVELVLDDHVVDLIEGDFDVGLRVGSALQDSTLVSRHLSSVERVLCGAPEYFERFGRPQAPIDLHRHRCLVYSLSSSPKTWLFSKAGEIQSVDVTGPLIVNNSLALRDALTTGVGISLIPTFIVSQELASGTLVQTLPDFQPTPQSLYVVYPQAKYVAQKIRTFVDFMADRFAGDSHLGS
ncbi:LysR family transcriptional regulator [Arenicella xantha]|uniref:DNA-binding transcriptional LysR family regulator n=1 Tax=Arenicella xantha TaxID=644221 RepID=A0A395JQS7_9GAMM|nr:LysR family transcriptional regulator [Arenicella xantha]RBP51070.1 DNA-binding transcriptional LysR family regulator [Arenicella xantha]